MFQIEKELRMDKKFLRLPPQSLELERSILGACMAHKTACEHANELIKPDYFYGTANKKIFTCINEMFHKQKAIDVLTVRESLISKNWLDDCGGEVYLSELLEVFYPENIIAHIKILREKYLKRSLIDFISNVLDKAYDDNISFSDIEVYIEKKLMDLSDFHETKTQSLGEILPDLIDDLENASKGNITGLTTGYRDIDEITGGLHGGDLTIIAARPSMGKTSILRNICKNVWDIKKKPVLIFSLEMTKKAMLRGFISSESGVSSNILRTGKVMKKDFDNISSCFEDIYQTNIFINDDSYLNVYQIRTISLREHRKHNFGLICIDYLQKIRDTKLFQNKVLETGEKSSILKSIAKELNIPVIALAQLSRAVENRPDKKPMLSDLRESGEIEQDADIVSFLYRPFKYGLSDDEKYTEFIIAKQREGATGTVKLVFEDYITKFKDYEDNGIMF